MRHIKPLESKSVSVFLGGSIEMGKATRWQDAVVEKLSNHNVDIYNPRRDDWDASWTQEYNNENFRKQVEWEVRNIQDADIVFMRLEADTISPISLFELGLIVKNHNRIVVSVPKGYFRYGNIEVYSKIFGFTLIEDFDIAVQMLINMVEYYHV